ncbi:hypothetical protein [Mesorhizobium sp. IMUNJ 23232]|uniref:hypothetical protein n=1 Tax=Mesorhizobium sp. IMUNJ 23232 TaxID=3376064 RepID=UPI00378E0841
MNILNAYARRATLSDDELGRLLPALKDQLERYRYFSRNYPRERMERYGVPYLAKLQGRVREVEQLIAERAQRLP